MCAAPRAEPDHEAGQRPDQLGVAAAEREQRAGGAAAAHLHAGAEQQRADREPDADRGLAPTQLEAEHVSHRQQRHHQRGRQQQHDGMGAEARRIPPLDQGAERAGKAEAGAEQDGADPDAHEDQRRHAPAIAGLQRDGGQQPGQQRHAGAKHEPVEVAAARCGRADRKSKYA